MNMAQYRITADYMVSKDFGVVEADSEDDAIEKILEKIPGMVQLCCSCSEEFIDCPVLIEDSITAEKE